MSDLRTDYPGMIFSGQLGGHEWTCKSPSGHYVGRVRWDYGIAEWAIWPAGGFWFTESGLADARDFLLQLNRRGAPGGTDD